MALPWLVVLELIVYGGSFTCGIISAASLTISQGRFAGQCLLYGSVSYNQTSQSVYVESFSSPSLCYFSAAVSVCAAVYCLSMVMFWSYASCAEEEVRRDGVWSSVSLAVSAFLLFLLLISGCTLRMGTEQLCQSVLHQLPHINRCEEAENKTWISPYDGREFYSSLHNAEMSVWVSFFFWLLMVAVVAVQRHQRSRNSGWSVCEREPFFHRP